MRIPANFCGVYGFKPTSMRGTKLLFSKQLKIPPTGLLVFPTIGPIGRNTDDLV